MSDINEHKNVGCLNLKHLSDNELSEIAESLGVSELSYRRGVSQALSVAFDMVDAGATSDDLALITNLSLEMRIDGKPHLAYLDELRKRYYEAKNSGNETNSRPCEGAAESLFESDLDSRTQRILAAVGAFCRNRSQGNKQNRRKQNKIGPGRYDADAAGFKPVCKRKFAVRANRPQSRLLLAAQVPSRDAV